MAKRIERNEKKNILAGALTCPDPAAAAYSNIVMQTCSIQRRPHHPTSSSATHRCAGWRDGEPPGRRQAEKPSSAESPAHLAIPRAQSSLAPSCMAQEDMPSARHNAAPPACLRVPPISPPLMRPGGIAAPCKPKCPMTRRASTHPTLRWTAHHPASPSP